MTDKGRLVTEEKKKEEPKAKEKIETKTEESPSKHGQSKEKKSEVELEDKKTIEAKSSLIKKKQEAKKPKKTEAIVRANNLPLSTKKALAICRFIKGKTISQAIKDLEMVVSIRKAVPVKGEYAHRKGKMMAGKYPQRAAKTFIVLLKSLVANASDLQEPIIYEVIANIGSRPYGRFGQIRRKRTHVFIKALEKNKINKKSEGKLHQNGRKKNS